VVVVNALYPLLAEVAAGRRSLMEEVPLAEFVDGQARPRTGVSTVAQIIAANLDYCARYLKSGEFLRGSRYYPSPDTFLCFYSDLVARFGARQAEADGLGAALRAAIEGRRLQAPRPSALETALRAIAARSVGLDPTPECSRLIETQAPDGAWAPFEGLYTLAKGSAKLYFGSRVLTALFAVRALSGASTLPRWRSPEGLGH